MSPTIFDETPAFSTKSRFLDLEMAVGPKMAQNRGSFTGCTHLRAQARSGTHTTGLATPLNGGGGRSQHPGSTTHWFPAKLYIIICLLACCCCCCSTCCLCAGFFFRFDHPGGRPGPGNKIYPPYFEVASLKKKKWSQALIEWLAYT